MDKKRTEEISLNRYLAFLARAGVHEDGFEQPVLSMTPEELLLIQYVVCGEIVELKDSQQISNFKGVGVTGICSLRVRVGILRSLKRIPAS